MLYCSAILVSILLFVSQSFAIQLHDVSILLPLPQNNELPLLLTPQSQKDSGPLLPRYIFDKFPHLIPEHNKNTIYNELLHVIGVRIDPCFVEGFSPNRCKRQLRLVWQPIVFTATGSTTRDAAVHTFHEFNEEEWVSLLSQWPSTPNTNQALYIHPQIQAEGFHGQTWGNLKSVILNFCSEKNLVRATAMNVMNGEQVWAFAAFDIRDNQTHQVNIPRINRTVQGIIMRHDNTSEFTGSFRPAPPQEPVLDALIQDSIGLRQGNNEAEIKYLMKRIYEYENPVFNNPGTLDCVSCHTAQNVRLWSKNHFKNWNWGQDFTAEKFASKWNIENLTAQAPETNNFRAFGYFTNKPAISQRVINETTMVLDALTQ